MAAAAAVAAVAVAVAEAVAVVAAQAAAGSVQIELNRLLWLGSVTDIPYTHTHIIIISKYSTKYLYVWKASI